MSEKVNIAGKNYAPLLWLTGVSLLAGLALMYPFGRGWHGFMHGSMGVFLCFFALIKFFNLPAFVRGFQMYDLMAVRSAGYAKFYPFIELMLGLGYLSFVAPPVIYIASILIFSFSALGVIAALRKGLNVNCACMGALLDVPLSTVTLTEDVVMVAMAVMMLIL